MVSIELVYIMFFIMLFIVSSIFFCVGWKLASYKNRDKLKWALAISIAGFYGIGALAVLPKVKVKENENE